MVTHMVHIWIKIGNLICLRHLFRSKVVGFFFIKKPVYLHTFAPCSDLPSNIRTKVVIITNLFLVDGPTALLAAGVVHSTALGLSKLIAVLLVPDTLQLHSIDMERDRQTEKE